MQTRGLTQDQLRHTAQIRLDARDITTGRGLKCHQLISQVLHKLALANTQCLRWRQALENDLAGLRVYEKAAWPSSSCWLAFSEYSDVRICAISLNLGCRPFWIMEFTSTTSLIPFNTTLFLRPEATYCSGGLPFIDAAFLVFHKLPKSLARFMHPHIPIGWRG